jgi:competence protein ComEC
MLQNRRVVMLLMVVFLVFAALDQTPADAKQLAKRMDVHFINVGQGDSIYIKTPNNKNVLIDAGPPKSGKKVVQYLKERGVKKIHLVIATHPDRDHIGGLPVVLKSFEVEHILDSGKLHVTRAYASYMNEVRRQEIPMTIAKVGKHISLDPLLDFRILNAYGKRKNNNQSSIALKLSYNDVDFLFLGDIEDKQESKIARNYDVRAEIIKIAHHGSKTSSSSEFLEEVDPNVAIISYSKFNRFGHPVNRVIKKLLKLNTHIYSTAAFGDLVIYTEGINYFIYPQKSPLQGILEDAK